MIACAFLFFGSFLALFDALIKFAFASRLSTTVKYTLALFFTALCLVPFYQGFSLSVLMYSFFDAPSALCVLLLGFFVCKIVVRDCVNKEFTLKFNPFVFALFFGYGLFIYLGNLDLIPYDIYNDNSFLPKLFVFGFLLALYGVDKICALLALIALLLFALSDGNNFLKALICPYLWVFSCIFLLVQIPIFIKGRLCKRH